MRGSVSHRHASTSCLWNRSTPGRICPTDRFLSEGTSVDHTEVLQSWNLFVTCKWKNLNLLHNAIISWLTITMLDYTHKFLHKGICYTSKFLYEGLSYTDNFTHEEICYTDRWKMSPLSLLNTHSNIKIIVHDLLNVFNNIYIRI